MKAYPCPMVLSTLSVLLGAFVCVVNGQGNGTATNFEAVACFEYEYTLQVLPSLSTVSQSAIKVGLTTVDSEGKPYLESVIYEARVDVQLLNFTSRLSGSAFCPDPPDEVLKSCASATCQICVETDTTLDKQLVEQMSLSKTRQFVADFNQDHENSILVLYQWPLQVRTTLVITFTGVNTFLNDAEQQRLIQEIKKTYGPILAQTGVGFQLKNVKIVLQGGLLQQTNNRNMKVIQLAGPQQQHRNLQTTTNGNKVELVLAAQCRGRNDCTPETFTQSVDLTSKEYVPKQLLNNLRQGQSSSDYFVRADELKVQATGSRATLLDINATGLIENITGNVPPASSAKQDIQEEQLPWWIWILIGGSAAIVAVGCIITWVAVQRRNKEEFLRHAYETDQKQQGLFRGNGRDSAPNQPEQSQQPQDTDAEEEGSHHDTVLDESIYTNKGGEQPDTPAAQFALNNKMLGLPSQEDTTQEPSSSKLKKTNPY